VEGSENDVFTTVDVGSMASEDVLFCDPRAGDDVDELLLSASVADE
jgi:hypothetical protein